MILAAGRGERMRPLSDATPKPLLEVGGKPLIVWQIEALARAGFRTIVINAAHLAHRMTSALGDGNRFGVTLKWSLEPEALETAGGIATAVALLPPGPALVVSGDIWTEFDYRSLHPRMRSLAAQSAGGARVHLVMVPNPAYHDRGDFVLAPAASDEREAPLRLPGAQPGVTTCTYANIGLYDTALFRELPRGVKLKLYPLFTNWIGAGIVTGELFRGPWANVGTPRDLHALDEALRRRN